MSFGLMAQPTAVKLAAMAMIFDNRESTPSAVPVPTISVVSASTLGISRTITLPRASQPYGIAFSRAASI